MFISPDTVIPDPTDFFSYNRYLYARGNPLKYNDPSGHCATNDDGSRSSADATCWSRADETVGSWAVDPQWWGGSDMTAQDWLTYVATQDYATTEFIEGRLYDFWSPKYLSWNVFHQRYNPAPTMHPVTNPPVEFPGQSYVTGYISTLAAADCTKIDCIAAGIDNISTAGSALAVASPACGTAAPGCLAVGSGVSRVATVAGIGWTGYNIVAGNVSANDFGVTAATTFGGAFGDPGIGVRAGIVQFIWDVFISSFD